LASVYLGRRYTDIESWRELSWLGDVRSERSSRLISTQACILAVVAVTFTQGTVGVTTVVTLISAAIALGLGAVAIGAPVAAGLGSLAWTGSWMIAGLVVARRLGFPAIELQATSSAVGAIAASFWLWALAGRLRAGKATLKSRSMRDSESVVAMCQRL